MYHWFIYYQSVERQFDGTRSSSKSIKVYFCMCENFFPSRLSQKHCIFRWFSESSRRRGLVVMGMARLIMDCRPCTYIVASAAQLPGCMSKKRYGRRQRRRGTGSTSTWRHARVQTFTAPRARALKRDFVSLTRSSSPVREAHNSRYTSMVWE